MPTPRRTITVVDLDASNENYDTPYCPEAAADRPRSRKGDTDFGVSLLALGIASIALALALFSSPAAPIPAVDSSARASLDEAAENALATSTIEAIRRANPCEDGQFLIGWRVDFQPRCGPAFEMP